MPDSDPNQHSTQEFVQLLNSFKGVEGDIKKMAEVLNEKTDKEKETKQLKASKDQTDKFANLAEKFDLFLRESKEARKEASDSEKEKDKDKKTSIESQRIVLEEMYATLTRSNVDKRTGETDKDPGGKEEKKKEIKTLAEQIGDTIERSFKKFTSIGPVKQAMTSTSTIAGELVGLLLGGGVLLALGKALGVPLADTVWNFVKSSWNVFSDFMTEKLGGWWTVIQGGLALIVANMTGLLPLITGAMGVAWSIVRAGGGAALRAGAGLLGGGAAAAEGAAAASAAKTATAARTAAATAELAEGASGVANAAKVATGVVSGFSKLLAGAAPVFSAISAKFNYEDAKKFQAAGLTEAAGMKTTALGLDITSGLLGVGALGAGLFAAPTAAAVLGIGAAATGIGGAVYSWFGNKKAETEKAQKQIEMDTTTQLDSIINNSKKEADALIEKTKQGFNDLTKKGKSLFQTSAESKAEHRQEFSNSVENLESAIDKSINALMDWDQRNMNPIQAISEMMKGMAGPKKSNPGSSNPVTTRDQVHDYRKSYRLQLGTAG